MEPKSIDCPRIKSKLHTTTISTAYNIILQIGLRLFSFIINAFILRFITKETLGIINVRLLLLYTTIQFITREPFRRTCAPNNSIDDDNHDDGDETKKSKNQQNDWSKVVNITFLSIPLSFVTGLTFSIIWYKFFERPEHLLYEYQWAIMSIYVSVIIESMAETFFIYGQRYDYIRLKVIVEGIFQTVRCSLLALFVYISPEHSVFGFAIAQLIASTIYSLTYFSYFLFKKKIPMTTFLPNFLSDKDDNNESSSSSSSSSSSLLETSLTFFYNSLLKQFLTEGERYIMTMFSVISFAEQGVYDVINNLGSLPARIIFQQIEENGYILFSSLIKRDLDTSQQITKILKSLSICSNLTKLMAIIGLTLFTYGYHGASIVLSVYGGQNFINGSFGQLAIHLFQWHCIYMIFIAINGILESYSFAVMNTRQLNRFNTNLLIISIIFTIISLIIISYVGSVGFIMANCLNMMTRIIVSLLFIGNIYPNYSLWIFIRQTRPNFHTIISYVLIFIGLSIVYRWLGLADIFLWSNAILFIIINVIIIICHFIIIIYFFEKELCLFVRNELLFFKSLKNKQN
uniref:Protein RFT1 homolog n=1 Tax=Dermatophagoides pteronyssinus TaxID=6956 RepID=A0A6P6YAN2_DERPT|nr:protein RFT1 homolog [Dermatophagoides pteronyssinus]